LNRPAREQHHLSPAQGLLPKTVATYTHHFFDRPSIFHRFLTNKVEISRVILDRKHSMTIDAPALADEVAAGDAQASDAAAFDAEEFGALSEMIGEDGVREMVEIFAADTRQRLVRLTAGGQNDATLMREMHTLKGAAGTVAAPRLALLGCAFERAAQRGIGPTSADLKAIDMALEGFLAGVRSWTESAGINGH
jgi:HPt (histidine-containing phosphotransfer) domain-containing protein